MRRVSRCSILCAAILLMAFLCAGCGHGQSGGPALEDYNVLIIVIDTLGADHVGCYNPELSHTPNIDRLAENGVRFKHSYAVAPWTQPSCASILTGLMPLYSSASFAENASTMAPETPRSVGAELGP